MRKRGVERRRLARAGRPGDQDDALLVVEQVLIASRSSSLMPSGSSESTVAFALRIRITTFSPSEAGRVETAEVHGGAVHRYGRAVLRAEPFRDVQPGHDLDAWMSGAPASAECS